MMHVTTTLIDTAPSLLEGIRSRLPSLAAMGSLASKGKALIEQRSLAGLEESGAPFGAYRTAPYYAPIENRPPGYESPVGGEVTKSGKSMKFASYATYKAAYGLGSAVQLSVSNQMLSDIDWIVQSSTRALLFFTSRLSAAKAHRHDSGYYPFFGLGDARSEDAMNDELLDLWEKVRRQAQAELKARRSKSR